MVIYIRRATPEDIARLKASPAGWEAFAFEEADAGELVDFDKDWHGVHFLLTGSAAGADSPLGIMLDRRETFGADKHGFGGFSVISPDEMRSFDAALKALDDETLARRYDPDEMAAQQLYLADLYREEGEQALPFLLRGVANLRKLSASCADAGDGALRILA